MAAGAVYGREMVLCRGIGHIQRRRRIHTYMTIGVTDKRRSLAAKAGTSVHAGSLATGPKKFMPKKQATKERVGRLPAPQAWPLYAAFVALCGGVRHNGRG